MIDEEVLPFLDVHVGVVAKYFGEGTNRGQRRTQFMGDRGHEIVLEPVEFLQAIVGRAQFRGGTFEFIGFLLELLRVGAHLARLVEDVHHFVETERLFLHHRRDHHSRRGRADGAGE